MDKNDIWIGKFKEGGYVVFDTEMQMEKTPYVYLFGILSNKMKYYKKNEIRKDLIPIKDKEVHINCIEQYLKWKTDYGKMFINLNTAQRLSELETELERRISHCWRCKRDLSDIRNKCSLCGWNICPGCNACNQYGCKREDLIQE